MESAEIRSDLALFIIETTIDFFERHLVDSRHFGHGWGYPNFPSLRSGVSFQSFVLGAVENHEKMNSPHRLPFAPPDPQKIRRQTEDRRADDSQRCRPEIWHIEALQDIRRRPPHGEAAGVRHVIIPQANQGRPKLTKAPAVVREEAQKRAMFGPLKASGRARPQSALR